MLIKRVAAKAHNATLVTDELGTVRPLKLLNYLGGGTRTARLDAVAVADIEALYQNGMILTMPSNQHYIISRITEDYFKTVLIRANLELVLCNNHVTISRQIVQSNNQGGVSGHIDTILHSGIPCKVIPTSQVADKVDDVLLQTYTVMISSMKPVEIGDRLQFDTTYNVAKIEGIKMVTEGLAELIFDRDLRW